MHTHKLTIFLDTDINSRTNVFHDSTHLGHFQQKFRVELQTEIGYDENVNFVEKLQKEHHTHLSFPFRRNYCIFSVC